MMDAEDKMDIAARFRAGRLVSSIQIEPWMERFPFTEKQIAFLHEYDALCKRHSMALNSGCGRDDFLEPIAAEDVLVSDADGDNVHYIPRDEMWQHEETFWPVNLNEK
jgi:hypothetical protein